MADQDAGEAKIYQRMQDATMKVAKLEKDLALQEEVLKKRHEEINSLNKENAKYKDQLDQIRKQFGNMEEIETRIKVAELKEEKINGLLNQLDQIMVNLISYLLILQTSTESNLSCYTCMSMMQEPHIVTPCGHAFCKKCIPSDQCPQCDKKVKDKAPVELIADLVTKYIYKRDAISTFKNDQFWKNKASAAK